jgi:hypothetical protein
MDAGTFAIVTLLIERSNHVSMECPQNKNGGGNKHPILDRDPNNYCLAYQKIHEVFHREKYIRWSP